jgi:hypothetical protein
MASQTTILAESINCNNFNTNHDKHNDFIIKVAKLTFNNTSSSDNFLKNAGFFTIGWPAHFYIDAVYVMFSNTNIVMGGTDETLLNIADDQGNSLVGDATNITIGSPPGAAGKLIVDSNTGRAKGRFEVGITSLSVAGFNLYTETADVTTEDRVFTGVIYHDATGQNNGNGDGATHTSGLDTAIVYIAFQGTRVS